MVLSRCIGVLALLLGLFLPLASLPLFALGYWDKAEPLVIGFHLTSALASLSVALAVTGKDERALPSLFHPFVLLPFALGLWTVLAAPFVEMPLLSLLGAPQSGYGGLWFLDLASLTACSLLIAKDQQAMLWLRLCAVLMLMLVAVLKLWDWWALQRNQPTLLIYIGAYYGWIGLALPLLFWRSARLPWVLAASILLALVSGSVALILLIPAFSLVVLLWRKQGWPVPELRYCLVAVLLAGLLPWLALHGTDLLLGKESLWDRSMIQQMLMAEMGRHPAWLLGHGWGRTQDAFFAWVNLSGRRLWNPDWIFLTSDYFHSHHWGLEALFSAGLPGLLLMAAGMLILPRYARPEARLITTGIAVSFALVSGLWFPLAMSVPVMALGLAAVADDRPEPSCLSRIRACSLIPLLLLAFQIIAAGMLINAGLQISRVRQAWLADPPRPLAVPRDFRGSDLALAELVQTLTSLQQGKPGASAAMLAAIDERAAVTTTPKLLEAGIGLLSQGLLAANVTSEQAELLEHWTRRLLAMGPGRSDEAIPLFSLWVAQGRIPTVAGLAEELLERNHHDPVGLHYLGLARLSSGDRLAGLALMRQALDDGIERFIPFDPQSKAILTQSEAGRN